MVAWSQVGAVWAVAGLLLGGVAVVDVAVHRDPMPMAGAAVHPVDPAARLQLFVGDARLSGALPPGLGVQRLDGDEINDHGATPVPPAPYPVSYVLAQAHACPVVTQ